MTTNVETMDGESGGLLAGRRTAWPRAHWIVCALVFAATTINYMDREVMGLLAPVLDR